MGGHVKDMYHMPFIRRGGSCITSIIFRVDQSTFLIIDCFFVAFFVYLG